MHTWRQSKPLHKQHPNSTQLPAWETNRCQAFQKKKFCLYRTRIFITFHKNLSLCCNESELHRPNLFCPRINFKLYGLRTYLSPGLPMNLFPSTFPAKMLRILHLFNVPECSDRVSLGLFGFIIVQITVVQGSAPFRLIPTFRRHILP